MSKETRISAGDTTIIVEQLPSAQELGWDADSSTFSVQGAAKLLEMSRREILEAIARGDLYAVGFTKMPISTIVAGEHRIRITKSEITRAEARKRATETPQPTAS